MKKNILLTLLVLVLGVALTACSSSGGRNGAVDKIRLPMGYIPNIQYAPFYVAVEKGYFKNAGIEIEFDYSFETDGVSLVGAGELPFAVASGEQVLLARSQGVPVTYITAWYQKFPVSVIAATDLNISEPADLRGQTIGVPGLFGASYIGVQALLFSVGLKPEDVTFEAIGFNQVGAFASGQSDVAVVYTANEPIQLRAQGFDLTELRVADYAQLASNGLLAGEKVLAEDPELVRAFVGAFIKGLKDTIDRPEEAMTISAGYIPDFETLDAKVQEQVLNTSIEMWKADRLGYSDPQAWENMQNVLFDMGLIKEKMDLGGAFTNEFIP
jgi:NitT/TauT family transport system substrate-binding protein